MEFLKNRGWRGAGILALALLLTSGIAFGQAQSGNIFVKAADEQGAALPGVSVTLTGAGAPLTQVTNVNGEVRFLSIAPGTYQLDFTLQGFAKVTRKNVVVALNQNTNITVPMKLAGVQESVVVTGESPLLDTKTSGTQAVVSKVELENVPTARDPWVIVQTAPGVQIDRLNVGGNQSGQQSNFAAKGTDTGQGVWNVDGVNITDMASLSSPNYYDFDSFAEMNVTIGGADASIQTPGVQLNMVTKRGTNDVHGSARVFITDRKTQSTNMPEELQYQLEQAGQTALGNQVDGIQDYGAELGGPLIKDKLWLWGSYGRNQINNVTAAGYPDRTTLENWGFKLNAQLIDTNTLTGVYTYGQKIKLGRNAGPTRPPETAYNQTGPTKLYKIEDSQIFSSDFFATASYSRVISEFRFDTAGQGQAYNDENGVWHYGFYNYFTTRPQTQVAVTPSYFLRTGKVGHEFKAGFTYRNTPVQSQSFWPQGAINYAPGAYAEDSGIAGFVRDGAYNTSGKYYSGYLQDNMTIDRLTIQLGVRYDSQTNQSLATIIPCCRWGNDFPEVPFKAITAQQVDPVTWNSWSPRVGVTYALGDQGKTLLKASYARFVQQLGGTTASFNSAASGLNYLYYYWNDKNGNQRVDKGEVDFGSGIYGAYGNFDPNNPNATVSQNIINYNMKVPHTDEFLFSVEHELMPAFVLGLQGTYRKSSNYLYRAPLSADGSRALTPADFTCTAAGPYPIPNGSPATIQVCNPKPGVASDYRIETNRPGYNTQYWGIDFSATKRYSDKWMLRFNFAYSENHQYGIAEGQSNPANLQPGTEIEGGPVMYGAGTGSGSFQYVWMYSRWQTTLSGMYTLPYDFNLATSIFAREGYPVPYYRRVSVGANPIWGQIQYYQLGSPDANRLPSVFEWDLGLSKVVKVAPLDITLMADVFNVLNRNTVLQRTTRIYDAAGSTTASDSRDNNIYEIQSPRIWRFGVRFSF
ncbi:MAG TPA: TonB-dependent receptor [Thermoanaerobaculia bacterium]|nr:TonB-dependent receptor [Thermoanaerobaculia bacterium]